MENIITEALNAASSLVEISRRYFPKSIRNSDRFQLENTCATINRAKEAHAAESDPQQRAMQSFHFSPHGFVAVINTDDPAAEARAKEIAVRQFKEAGITDEPKLTGIATLPKDGVIVAWGRENNALSYAAFIAERVGVIIGEMAVTEHWTPSQVAGRVRRELTNWGNLDSAFNRGYTQHVCTDCEHEEHGDENFVADQTDWSVYRTGDKTFPTTRHATQEEAEARIIEIAKTDPTGVENGDYSIDGPTE